jgi:DNA-binding transcriptional MerR regulator
VVVAGEEEHMRTVGELADLAGVTVRTLHHYDEIGLLSPSARSPAGYRLYDEADLLRLRQILFYRELDFPLDDIGAIVADKDVDAGAHLRRQHRLLRERIERMCSLVDAIEHEMEAQKLGISLTPAEQFEVFGAGYRGEEWAAEAEQRWSDTDAWSQSNRRTSAYPKEDWLRIKAEADGIEQRFAELLRWVRRLTVPQRSRPRANTGSTLPAGSMTARRPCTAPWVRCTSPTHGSPRTTTQSSRVSPGTSVTLSLPRPIARAAKSPTGR